VINFWKLSYEAVKKQRDQYKAENQKLKEQIDTSQVSRLIAENEQLKEEVEHLKGIIQDEEDWKLLKLEEEWL
jgi:hypothetical protein